MNPYALCLLPLLSCLADETTSGFHAVYHFIQTVNSLYEDKMKTRKTICVLLTLAYMLSLSAFADVGETAPIESNLQEDAVFKYSEYDAIVNLRTMEDWQLESMGIDDNGIEYIRSSAIEDELLYRKTRPIDELKNYYGYTDDEISILMNYNGEPLESNPELQALTATLTISKPQVMHAGSSVLHIQVAWQWDTLPLDNVEPVYDDALAISWVPTFVGGGNLRLDTSASKHIVTYTFSPLYAYDRGVVQNELLSSAIAEFPMKETGAWAKKGLAMLYLIKTDGSGTLASVDMQFKYAHTMWGFDPSISFSFPAGISVNISEGTTEADSRSGYVDIDDGVWVDN